MRDLVWPPSPPRIGEQCQACGSVHLGSWSHDCGPFGELDVRVRAAVGRVAIEMVHATGERPIISWPKHSVWDHGRVRSVGVSIVVEGEHGPRGRDSVVEIAVSWHRDDESDPGHWQKIASRFVLSDNLRHDLATGRLDA